MPKNDPEYERGFTDGFNAGANGIKATSDAQQLMELRRDYDFVVHDLRQVAFAYHVGADHKPAFAICRDAICANACRVFNAHRKEKVTG